MDVGKASTYHYQGKNMKVAYISDIHYDMYFRFDKGILYENKWDVLVIGGDTGHITDVIKLCNELSNDFPESSIIVITGNHEYYHSGFPIGETDQKLKDWASKLDNVHVLINGEKVTIDDVDFIGATLWTDFGERISHVICNTSMLVSSNRINDFYYIFSGKNSQAITPTEMKELHEIDRHGIIQSLESSNNRDKTVVITHFSPTVAYTNEDFPINPITYYFSATMDDIIEKYQPKVWISGHTHSSRDLKILGETEMRSNQSHEGGNHKLKYFDI